jgi:hypothetical protein
MHEENIANFTEQRSSQDAKSLCWSRYALPIMGPEDSLLCSQELSTNLHPEGDISNSHPTSLRSIFILPSHLCLGVQSYLFLSGFLTKIVYAFLIYPMYATCLTHLILLDFFILIIFGEGCKL